MLNRHPSLAVLLFIAASIAALGQNPGAEYLFQLPGSTATGQFVPYNAVGNPLGGLTNTAGPNGINLVIPMPDGSKFYLIGTNAVQAVDPTFQNFHGVNLTEPSGLIPTITAATLTPNGSFLLIGTTDSQNNSFLFVVNTSTDQQLTGSGLPLQLAASAGPYVNDQGAPCPQCWIVVSYDSQEAYVLENSFVGTGAQIAVYSLSTFQKIGNAVPSAANAATFGAAGNGLTLSPNGVLYLAANNLIAMIDPVSLNQIGGSIHLPNVNCSQLQFTPDGTTAYAINQAPFQSGPSLVALTVVPGSTPTMSYWPAPGTTGPPLSAVFVGGNNNCASGRCIFAFSSSLTTFYDVTPASAGLSASISDPSPTLATAIVAGQTPCPNASNISGCILSAAISNELPASNYLYVLVANGTQPYLDRISITSDSVSVSDGSPVLTSGIMEFASIPTQGTASSFGTFNSNQTVNTGQTSIPLIAQAIGPTGLPVFNTQGTFSAASGTGLVVNTPNVTTGSGGFVQTTVSVPAGGVSCPTGTCTVTLNLGGASTTFSINVPGSATGGGGTGGTGGSGGSTSPEVILVSGQGQLIPAGTFAQYPLTVQVTNAAGVPQTNVTVTWTVTGNGAISATSVQTDVNGMASVNYGTNFVSTANNTTFETDTIVASAPQGSVTFYETGFLNAGPNIFGIQTSLISPLPGQVIQVSPGSPAVNAVQAQIFTIPFGGFASSPIPNVGLILIDPNSPNVPPSPTANFSCQGNPVSDTTGTVTCTIVTTCSTPVGIYPLDVAIGGINPASQGTVQVTSDNGGAAQIAITSGNNQSGSPGKQAALPLEVTLTNSCGTPITTGSVTWKVTSGSATLSQSTESPNPFGQVTNTVTFGSTPGPVVITATVTGGASVTFNLTNSVTISAINAVSGAGQNAITGQAFANALVVSVVDNNKNPISGVAVTFTVTSGSATVNPTSANTGSNGQAQTTVTAGGTAGAVVVTASVTGGLSTAFNLTVTPPGPAVTASSFVNAASGVAGLVPCGLGVVTGAGLAPGVQGVISGVTAFGPLPYSLGPITSFTVNGVPAPIQAVSNQNNLQQINFQTPCETPAGGSVPVVITVSGSPATTISNVPVFAAQPGIFTYAGPNNQPYGAVISAANGTYVTPSNLAVRGQTYYVVVTGLGQTSPPLTTNQPGNTSDNVIVTAIVGVNNVGVPVISATALPDVIGGYLVAFEIPITTPASLAPVPLSVAVIVNGVPVYSNTTFLPGFD